MKRLSALTLCFVLILSLTGTAFAYPDDDGFPNFNWGDSFPTRGKGAHSNLIKGLQTFLRDESPVSPGTVDGVFGTNSYNSVRSIQLMYDCQVDGIVGPETWGRMFDNLWTYTYAVPWVLTCNSTNSWQDKYHHYSDGSWHVDVNGNGTLIPMYPY